MAEQPAGFYTGFLGEEQETIRLQVRSGPCPEFPRERATFNAGRAWKLYRHEPGYVFEVFDTFTGETNIVAFVSDEFSHADVYVFPVSSSRSRRPWSLPRLMQPLGQLLLISFLARRQGAVVHASAVDDGGRGTVFVGPSGAGKSTMAGLWSRHAGVPVLSDEFVILRRLGGRLYAYGTPWAGTQVSITPQPGPVEVQRIFWIGHHPEHRVWCEPESTLAGRLFSQLFLPFWDREALQAELEFCHDLVKTTPCRRLGFARNANIIDFLRRSDTGGMQ